MAKLALFMLCATLLAGCAHGCGFLDIKCKIQGVIQEIESQLIDKAREAFEQAMDHVFDRDISPLLDKAIAAIDAGIDKVDRDVNETINHIESAIETIIQDAAQTANALATNVTHDIEEIIRKATTAMEQVEDTFYRDASNLLTQLNQIVQKGQCMEASGAAQIRNQIYKLLNSLNPSYRFSYCWLHQLNYTITMSLEGLSDIQLYNYQKICTLLDTITPTTPIKGTGGILQTYAQGQLYASEYYCIGETANSPAFQDQLSKEWLWWGVQYNLWNNIGISKHRGLHTVKASQGGWVPNDTCGTPVECYGQAIKALEDAEQKILSIKSGLLDLNNTVMANTAKLSNNSRDIVENKNTLAKNNASINNNTKKFSTLRAYPCQCTDTTSETCTGNVAVMGSQRYCINSTYCTFTQNCCKICLGTAEEAAAYALAHPMPIAMKNNKLQARHDRRKQNTV